MSSGASMLVPTPPAITRIERISPTLYEAAMKCTSRAAWLAGGDRKLLPPHPRALLGIGVHAVLERARSGRIAGTTDDERRSDAERLVIENWRQEYNDERPKRALGGLTPAAFARQLQSKGSTVAAGL